MKLFNFLKNNKKDLLKEDAFILKDNSIATMRLAEGNSEDNTENENLRQRCPEIPELLI